MPPKQLNHKSAHIKSSSNEQTMVNYPIYNPCYDNVNHIIVYYEF